MNRRDLMKAGLGAMVVASATARGDDPIAESDPAETIKKLMPLVAKTPIETVRLSDTLHIVTGAGGNIAVLIGPDGATVVDSGIPDKAKPSLEASRKIAGKPIATLINTHWHFDHAGGNLEFHRSGAQIIATANTRKRLSADQYTEVFKMTTPASPRDAQPSVTVDEAELHVGDETLHLISVPPAHTDGDLIVHFRNADVIHAGDLFNNGFYPNIDASSGGWLGGMIGGCDRVIKLAGSKTKIIPGHGSVATLDDLVSFRKMLGAIYDRVSPMVDAGKSVDQVILARPTQPFDSAFGKGFFNGHIFARIVYDGLLKHREEKSR
jgi:cyclase